MIQIGIHEAGIIQLINVAPYRKEYLLTSIYERLSRLKTYL